LSDGRVCDEHKPASYSSHTQTTRQTPCVSTDRHTRQTPGNDHTTTDTDTFGATVTEVLGSLSGSSGSATWPDPDGHPEMALKNGTAATTYSTPPCSRRSSVALIQSGAVPVPSAIRNASFLLCREIVRFFCRLCFGGRACDKHTDQRLLCSVVPVYPRDDCA
jgi:hypothetical protein